MEKSAIPIIEAIDVCKRYKSVDFLSVDQQSLSIYKGEKFGIFGPNGAGKTTLIGMLSGLITPSSGEIVYHISKAALPVKEVFSTIGLVPQEYAFFSELTPKQNCQYFGALYGIPTTILNQRIQELMAVLGLEQVANQPVQHFSGGMKRRVNLALGILHAPCVLFLDEPTVGVDVQSRMAILNYLDELHRLGTTIIYTSHHLKEAEAFCDRLAILDQGRIIAMDRMDRLIAHQEGENLESVFIKLTGTDYRD